MASSNDPDTFIQMFQKFRDPFSYKLFLCSLFVWKASCTTDIEALHIPNLFWKGNFLQSLLVNISENFFQLMTIVFRKLSKFSQLFRFSIRCLVSLKTPNGNNRTQKMQITSYWNLKVAFFCWKKRYLFLSYSWKCLYSNNVMHNFWATRKACFSLSPIQFPISPTQIHFHSVINMIYDFYKMKRSLQKAWERLPLYWHILVAWQAALRLYTKMSLKIW